MTPRGRPPVKDKRRACLFLNKSEKDEADRRARAAGYSSTSQWARVKLGLEQPREEK